MAMTLRTDAALEAALDVLVAEERTSRQEAIRRAVIERAERYARRREIADLSEAARAEWDETLRRLGSA
jgi:metal-responsive CopG/Arc/MetJ family transcriptional regulator